MKNYKEMSRTKKLFIISMVLLVGWFGFSSIPSVAVALGGGCGFFFLITISATIISFVKGHKKEEVRVIIVKKTKVSEVNQPEFKVCKYCGSENKFEEVKCLNCGASLKK